ncbi:MAG TPA: putative metal-binding motif-containing protein, partial [Myxococcota bacterium]|nr:putative metal-binding motif-containing protein [Myxococcota bacterium]
MRLLLLSLAMSCGPSPGDGLAVPQAPVAGSGLTLSMSNLVAGELATFSVTGGTPGFTVELAMSTSGLGDGPCPAAFGGGCFDLAPSVRRPGFFAPIRPDGSGAGGFFLPAHSGGRYVAFQAVDRGNPSALSNPVGRPISSFGITLTPAGDLDGDGVSIDEGDCADFDDAFGPGALDLLGDGIDHDCDGADGTDLDGDGYASTASGGDDCDDADAGANPGMIEVVGDGVDADCDGDELCYEDRDGDGYLDGSGATIVSLDADCADAHEAGAAAPTTDCDDLAAARHPGAVEVVDDGVDQDCDTFEACFDDDDDDGYLDASGDQRASADLDCLDPFEGRASDLTTDCNDAVAAVRPGVVDVIGDGVDNDCDGVELCYDDDDNDGYLDGSGDTRASADLDCLDAFEGTASDLTTDCNDAVASIRPGAAEVCNDVDDDCDGFVDEGFSCHGSASYAYSGANQTFAVPAGVTSVQFKVWGAGGAGGAGSFTGHTPDGGGGGFVSGTLAVTPGESLTIIVGGGGQCVSNSVA